MYNIKHKCYHLMYYNRISLEDLSSEVKHVAILLLINLNIKGILCRIYWLLFGAHHSKLAPPPPPPKQEGGGGGERESKSKQWQTS